MKAEFVNTFPPKLLVIDDDEGITDFIKHVTEEMDFSVNCVNDHESIGETFRNFKPDVIFLDLCLPGYDGVEVLHFLADMGCKSKIFLISGIDGTILKSASEVGKQCNLNIAGTLAKPFLIEDIQTALKNELEPSSKFTTQEFQNVLGAGEFVLSYRPRMAIRSLAGSAIASVEAHVNWVGKQAIPQSAGIFMPKIRAANLIKTYCHVVVDKALETYSGWSSRGLDIGIVINIDDAMIIDHTLPGFLASEVDKCGISPNRVTFGISEKAALSNSTAALDFLTRLRIKGFKVSIETIGSDSSDLNKLLHLPFTELRISRDIVRRVTEDVEAEFNVSTLISLCNKAGLATCVDGIETEACLKFIYDCGATEGQGIYFGDILQASEVERFATGNKNGSRETETPMHETAGSSG